MENNRLIVCAMASFPPRKVSMMAVINNLLPQCDKICIYLNEYDSIPQELINEKIEVILGKENLKENGRLKFIEKYNDSYYLTVDDDISYPMDYVQNMILNIDKYGGNSIISYHGAWLSTKQKQFYMFFEELKEDRYVNRQGGGVSGFIPINIGIKLFTDTRLIMLDGDMILSIYAENRGIRKICVKHDKNWIKPIIIDGIEYQNICALKDDSRTKEKRKKNKKIFLQKGWKSFGDTNIV